MGRVVYFEIHAEDPAACAEFYSAAFGWRITHHPAIDYWSIETGDGPGVNGGIVRRRGPGPETGQAVNAFVCTLGTEDLNRDLAAVLANGARLALGRFSIPYVGHSAYFHDPAGNIVGLHQADPDAR